MFKRIFKFGFYSIFSFFIVTCLASILPLEKQQKILRMPFEQNKKDPYSKSKDFLLNRYFMSDD